MAYANLVSLAQTIDHCLNDDRYSISISVKRQLISIYNHVVSLQELLEDSASKAIYLEGQMRDVANEAENKIEELMSAKWQSDQHQHELERVSLEIDLIVEQVKNIESSFKVEGEKLLEPSQEAASSSSRATNLIKDNLMVGFDDDLIRTKDRLCGFSSKLEVIPIFGMGGIGKTTLAKSAYEDSLIIEYFYIRAWVTISQDYSAYQVLSALLISMKVLNEEKESTESMAEKVYKKLKGRRYLIVVDDMWSTKVWDELKMVFPDDNNGSRIMLTTRLYDVAAHPNPLSSLHEMHLLDEDQSWNLLRQKVFTHLDCPKELESIGKEIARNCRGLPLAIVVIGGILSAVTQSPASWGVFAENVSSIIATKDEHLEPILSLSYTNLPHHLRPCFLYLGGFPEDHEIRVSKLIKLWVAEGFLRHPCGSKKLEDEAEECLEDLVRRSLVMVTKRKSNGKIKSCSLHDMMRDLCIRKALEEKFLLNLMDGRAADELAVKGVKRISIGSYGQLHLLNIFGSTIHTVICFNANSGIDSLIRFRLLKVLDARNAYVESLPRQLFELFQLRLLAINYDGMIPPAISKLQNLQTLILTGWNQCLPMEIWTMPRLRHLLFYGWIPEPEGTMLFLENLQTLSLRSHSMCTEGILKAIRNIKKLKIDCSGFQVCTYLNNLVLHLHQLEIFKLHSVYGIDWQKCDLSFPRTLKKVSLSGLRLPWNRMTIFGSLPNLQVLKVRDYACIGSMWETEEGEFPKLEVLQIEISDLEHWITERSHFFRLKYLVLDDCRLLREIPEGIGEISTLELIEVKGKAEKSLLDSARRIQDEQQSWGNDGLQIRCMTY